MENPDPSIETSWMGETWLYDGLTPEEQEQLGGAQQLLTICHMSTEHTRQVTFLSLRLFDELQSLHGLTVRERFWLECAALLHDIGWVEGQKNHHKNSLQIILTTPLLLFDQKERLVIGSIARYHRKALPTNDHDHFQALDAKGKRLVSILASMLRLANALDASHNSLVQDCTGEVSKKKIVICCTTSGDFEVEKSAASDRRDLMQSVFQRDVLIKTKKQR